MRTGDRLRLLFTSFKITVSVISSPSSSKAFLTSPACTPVNLATSTFSSTPCIPTPCARHSVSNGFRPVPKSRHVSMNNRTLPPFPLDSSSARTLQSVLHIPHVCVSQYAQPRRSTLSTAAMSPVCPFAESRCPTSTCGINFHSCPSSLFCRTSPLGTTTAYLDCSKNRPPTTLAATSNRVSTQHPSTFHSPPYPCANASPPIPYSLPHRAALTAIRTCP